MIPHADHKVGEGVNLQSTPVGKRFTKQAVIDYARIVSLKE